MTATPTPVPMLDDVVSPRVASIVGRPSVSDVPLPTSGAWFKFEALYPNGKKETLLSVPHYDFSWQHNYRLKEPKRMPAGTWILCSGGYDNSAMNPYNPDPKTRVHWGDQSFDEMFIGFMGIAELPNEKALSSK